MKRCLAVLLCLAFLPLAAAFAQQPGDPATREDVQKLFEIQNSRKMFDSIMTAMKQQIPALTQSAVGKQLPNATAEQTAQLNAFVSDSMEKMFRNMPFDELMAAMLPAYQHHFTHGEIQELIRFYSSPVGKKLLTEMPAIMTEYMQAAMPVIQKWTTAQMSDLQVSAEDYAKSLKYARNASPAPPPAASPAPAAIPSSLSQPMDSTER